jgi:hypothetical protein
MNATGRLKLSAIFSYILSPRLRWLALIVAVYFIAGVAMAIEQSNREFIFYGACMAVFVVLILTIDRRVTLSSLALWGLALWGSLHLAGGLLPVPAGLTDNPSDAAPVLYDLRLIPWLPKFDQMVHAFGFGMCTIVAHESLSVHFGRKLPINFPIGASIMLIAMGLGAANEIIEFVAVLLMPETNVGGYVNTGWDLISNTTGSAVAVLYLKLWHLRKL